jgi:lipopolysaccharide transport system ATP-binding protein
MNDFAISCQGLGKLYQIGQQQSYQTLRDALAAAARAPFNRRRRASEQDASSTIWALKDVSLDVKRGEVLGIIGRNGAGKSTLLKILSRITKPTTGSGRIQGRVGSLLEVGTGFHPELTGRENIYLNGAILGMRKKETDRKFDEIVEFAEVEKFVDTPIKRYSSGMYMRLAFAVAAHLDPEILLIDEVLAVGDIDFQKKCIGSMQSVARSGRTVLVVSHNMALIETLCESAVWLDGGEIVSQGRTRDVINNYLTKPGSSKSTNLLNHPRRSGNAKAKFSSIQILSHSEGGSNDVRMGGGITIRLDIAATQPIQKPWIGIEIRTALNQLLFYIANREAGYELEPIDGNSVVKCHIAQMNLLPDRYFIDLVLADMSNTLYDQVYSAAHFDVIPSDVLGTGMPMGKDYGLVFYPTEWELSREGEDESPVS